MCERTYEYDVAFSFLAQDESLAVQINDLLQGRAKTFLYSERQKEIAGTDGELTFNRVFGQQSRLVVVLYRPGWGQSPWTRIEETAIRNRAHEDGYDFVIFIPLEKPESVPKWLPKGRLWIGLDRWGLTGAASVIESRIQELGGEPHEETVPERAARLERARLFEQKRTQFLQSEKGVSAARTEYKALISELGQQILECKEAASSVSLQLRKVNDLHVVTGLLHRIDICWECHYTNSLDHAELRVDLWEGYSPGRGFASLVEPSKMEAWTFRFDLLQTEQACWVQNEGEGRSFSTPELASFILKSYMDNQG